MDIRNVSRYAFLAFLFLLPLSTVLLLREPFVGGEKWQYGTIGLYGTDILLVLAIMSAMIARYREHAMRTEAWAILMFLVWAGISISWATDTVLAGYFFVKLLLASGVFWLARSMAGSDARLAVTLLVVAAAFQAMSGVGQFLSQASFSSTLLGMSAHESWQAGTSVLKNESGRWLRAYGTFPHPNMLGGFLGAILILVMGRIIFFDGDQRSRIKSGITIASTIVILLGLILTFSRTAWLGAALGLLGIGAYAWSTGNKSFKKRLLYSLGVLAIAVSVFAAVLHETILPRFDGATIASERSVSEREISLDDARTLIMAHPFIGVGGGSFTAAIIDGEPDRPIWSIQPAHNAFALVLAELGIIGLVLFSFVLGSILFQLKQGKNMIFAVAFLTLIPSLFLDHWIFTSHFGILLFFLLAGLATRRQVTV